MGSKKTMSTLPENEVHEILDGPESHHQSTGTVLIDGHDINDEILNEQKYDELKEHNDPKRKYIEKEIIETEETYYRGLNTLLNELIIPLFDHNLIDDKYFKQCTSNLPQLLSFHDRFLSELVEVY